MDHFGVLVHPKKSDPVVPVKDIFPFECMDL